MRMQVPALGRLFANRRGNRLGVGLLAVSVAVSSGPDLSAALPVVTLPHITLEKSEPADGATAASVSEIRLFFTGAPLMRGASVRVVTTGRQLMRSSPPAPDAEDPRQLFVTIEPPLPPGSYVVQWRCIADDGHVMRGDFRFDVATQ
jgi:methionine-rich copper-binding protein CopC